MLCFMIITLLQIESNIFVCIDPVLYVAIWLIKLLSHTFCVYVYVIATWRRILACTIKVMLTASY